MIEYIIFGVIDNAVMLSGALFGVSIEKKLEELVFLLMSVEVWAKDKKTIDHFYIIGILRNKDIDMQLIGKYYEPIKYKRKMHLKRFN